MHEIGLRSPVALVGCCHDGLASKTKKPAAKSRVPASGQRSFSDLFNVAASRPAKSPRDKRSFRPPACLRQSGALLNVSRSSERSAVSFWNSAGSRDRRAVRRAARSPRRAPLDADQNPTSHLDLSLRRNKAFHVRASFLPPQFHTVVLVKNLSRLEAPRDFGLNDRAVARVQAGFASCSYFESLALPETTSAPANPQEFQRAASSLDPRHNRL